MKIEVKMSYILRKLIVLFCLLLTLISFGQNVKNSITIEVLAATSTNSRRFFNHNENDHFYFELRAGYRINNFFEINFFTGYKLKGYIYFAQKNGNLLPLFMDRHYVPVGINGRIYYTDFFYEKLKLWKKPGRWDIYNQVGVAILKGKDINDSRENEFRNQGYFVPYYLYPYVTRYNKGYLTYLFGVRYNFSKHIGLFLEGGVGALNDLQIGMAAKF
ncbi:MAG TPA: hypothetical protein VKB95_08410 [Chitinophagaceae bacterium]|nr:hypothetical protein [Chitinophagaceae bacterium]